MGRCGSLWIVVGHCGSFRVLVTTNGAHVTLQPGRRYSSLDAMGLVNPVVSLRMFNKVKSK